MIFCENLIFIDYYNLILNSSIKIINYIPNMKYTKLSILSSQLKLLIMKKISWNLSYMVKFLYLNVRDILLIIGINLFNFIKNFCKLLKILLNSNIRIKELKCVHLVLFNLKIAHNLIMNLNALTGKKECYSPINRA